MEGVKDSLDPAGKGVTWDARETGGLLMVSLSSPCLLKSDVTDLDSCSMTSLFLRLAWETWLLPPPFSFFDFGMSSFSSPCASFSSRRQ